MIDVISAFMVLRKVHNFPEQGVLLTKSCISNKIELINVKNIRNSNKLSDVSLQILSDFRRIYDTHYNVFYLLFY